MWQADEIERSGQYPLCNIWNDSINGWIFRAAPSCAYKLTISLERERSVCCHTLTGSTHHLVARPTRTAPLQWTPATIRGALSERGRDLNGPLHTDTCPQRWACPGPIEWNQLVRDVRTPPVIESDGCDKNTGPRVGKGYLEPSILDQAQVKSCVGPQICCWLSHCSGKRFCGVQLHDRSALPKPFVGRVWVEQIDLKWARLSVKLLLLRKCYIHQQIVSIFTLHPLA